MVEDIFCLAGIAAATGDPARAARLAGAADLDASQIPPLYIEDSVRIHQPNIESSKLACDPGVWDRAFTDGRSMSLDEAAQHALS
jgi:hypothetical protein